MRTFALAIATFCAGACTALAQSPPSFTAPQAERGEAAYMHSCRMCHGDNLDDGDFGGAPLKGSWFRDHWGQGDVAALSNFTRSQMPPDRPGGLNEETYTDIVAFLLSRNGYRPGDKELPIDEQLQQAMTLRRSAD